MTAISSLCEQCDSGRGGADVGMVNAEHQADVAYCYYVWHGTATVLRIQRTRRECMRQWLQRRIVQAGRERPFQMWVSRLETA
jgi:hypothetical protein